MYRGIVLGKSVYEPWFWFDLVQSTVSAKLKSVLGYNLLMTLSIINKTRDYPVFFSS